jgi:cytochrome bd-type quinol oxidase subunit 2
MINCICYPVEGLTINTKSDLCRKTGTIAAAIAVIAMVAAVGFYGICVLHNPAIAWSQLEYVLGLIAISIVASVTAVLCSYMEKKNNPEPVLAQD